LAGRTFRSTRPDWVEEKGPRSDAPQKQAIGDV
jgi:hypothetical protein